MPYIDLIAFPKELRSWWISLQPSARRGTSLLRTANARNADWSGLQHGGLDGMFAIIMCLSWYMISFPPPVDQRPFAEFVDDVTWVFTCLNAPDESVETESASTRRRSRTSVKRSVPEPTTKASSKRARA